MKIFKKSPFSLIKNNVLRKSIIGLLIFIVILSITLLIRFLNLSGAIIGFFFYSILLGIFFVEFTTHYGFKKWQQFILISIAILIFVFPINFYSSLLRSNGFDPINYNETGLRESLPSNLISPFVFSPILPSNFSFPNYLILLVLAILTLLFFALNSKLTIRDIPKILIVTFVIIFFVIFSRFIFFLNFSSYTLFIMLIVGVIFADSFAYFGGKLLGQKIFKRKLAPTISPNKTIEGAIIGTLFSAIFILGWGYGTNVFGNYRYSLDANAFAIICALIIPIISIFGDLFFSWIKRNLKIKDFSVFFPEHGGLLDRFDSLSFATWFISLVLIFAGVLFI
ncbi:phosphatidate cytidylyltransferase [[Mycoplasma] mobile]|uniref:Phosphatidate cytidylyltransferase n=1 Tax=Mycoplasma mobile (strain ATCC 43663 / 163K / NCTC 11711) TaxID=267748 RepID=Q6KIN4_MYCM1|nr:phosphatidate cytidylyltransferase [[Mycoplasma] mobile]AAT27542.1 phosphatidate cytidylyltransferase [Mycoplasma mobile 163K]